MSEAAIRIYGNIGPVTFPISVDSIYPPEPAIAAKVVTLIIRDSCRAHRTLPLYHLRLLPGGSYILGAAPVEMRAAAKRAEQENVDIGTAEKAFWIVILWPVTTFAGGLIGLVLGLGILVPVVYWQALKWHDILFYRSLRRVIYHRLSNKLATKGIVVGQALDIAPPRTATKDVVQPEPGILTTVTEVSASDFYQRVNKSSVPVLVQFWAPWCSCCKTIAPVIDDIARQFHARVAVVRVNTDKNSQLVKQHGITSTPTFLIVHKGQVVDRIVGVQTREVFTEKLQSVQDCINSGA